jgi:hypothetical protein
MNARAQMPAPAAPRAAAPAMPQGGGGAPHINAARGVAADRAVAEATVRTSANERKARP